MKYRNYGVTSCKCGSAKEPFKVRLQRSRLNATIRERQRLAKINHLLERLSSAVPEEFQGLATKADVIRGAADYIRTLATLLRENDGADNETNRESSDPKGLPIIGKRNRMTSGSISPKMKNQPGQRSSMFHLDPQSHNSLITPGVVKMDEPVPSVVVDWNPVGESGCS